MRLERLHEYILATVVISVGVVLAAAAGKYAGGGNVSSLGMIVAVAVLALIGIQMRARIWILIPLTSTIGGKLPFMPLPFSIQELGVLIAFGWYLVFKAVKIVRNKPVYTMVDYVMFANLAWMASVFIRNPVGSDSLGSDRVGGHPYFAVIVGILAWWVLSRADLTEKEARRLPFYLALGTFFDAVAGMITYKFPSTVPFLSKLYSGISADTYLAEGIGAGEASERLGFLQGGGTMSFLALCSYFRPITIINPTYFFRFSLTIISLVLILFSGFRTALLMAAFAMFAGSYFRKRIIDIWTMAFVLLPILIMVILMNGVVFKLPIPAQRALSFLPGNWDANAKADAEGSVEWRQYMWKAMLTEKKYINNRWLGDGFGYTREVFREMLQSNAAGGVQESFLITGQVHSGPLSAIKYVGIIGFLLYLGLILASAREAVRLIHRSWGTPFFAAALFVGIPIMFSVVGYVAIFGGYDANFPQSILTVGLLKLISRGISEYEAAQSATKETREPEGAFRPALLMR